MTHEVAIIGAGAAGAGAAYALRDSESAVTVLEKSRGVCGRAASRRKNGCIYDHGANYIKSDDERVSELIEETLDAGELVDISEPVWTFDSEGKIEEGRDGDDHKWSYREGITGLAKRLFDRTDAVVENETRVERIERAGGDVTDTASESEHRWRPIDTEGNELGEYDTLLLTPPAPQTATLVGETDLDEKPRADLVEEIEGVGYKTQLTAVLHYPFAIEVPYYALVNTDRAHDVAWVSREECKAGHVPDEECLLITQMAPDWSVERYGEAADDVTDAAADLVGELFDDERLQNPDWADVQRWRFALPESEADSETLARAESEGVFFAGDWVVGEGRVHAALRNGLETGDRIGERPD